MADDQLRNTISGYQRGIGALRVGVDRLVKSLENISHDLADAEQQCGNCDWSMMSAQPMESTQC